MSVQKWTNICSRFYSTVKKFLCVDVRPYFTRFWGVFCCLYIIPYFPVMVNGIKWPSKKPSSSENVNVKCTLRGSLFWIQNFLRLESPTMILFLKNYTNNFFSYLLSLSVSLCSHAFLFLRFKSVLCMSCLLGAMLRTANTCLFFTRRISTL